MSDIQLDLFGEPIQPKRQKKAKLVQGELFPARELAQFGIRANPVMDESPGKLALQREDIRTADEIERERSEDAQALTVPLPGTSEQIDAGDIVAVVYHYIDRAFTVRLKNGTERPPVKAEMRLVKMLYIQWPISSLGGGRIVKNKP